LNSATAILTIDLDAVIANWRRLAERVRPAECAAVVKADAYGLGALRVAPALYAAGCRTFFVATIDEGLSLRPLLPEARLLVLCGVMPGTADEFTAHHLIPVLNSLEQVEAWADRGEAALHVDTGMARLGIEPTGLARLGGFRPVMVMSHMACADEPGAAMNRAQLEAFGRVAAAFPGVPASLAASSAIFLGPEWHFHMVRPGAALYGLNPTAATPNPMGQVVRLQGKILQVRDVDSPMTVGYGASHRVARPGRIATVAAGYADGLFRTLGNRGHGFIGGEKVPVVGRVSMDLTTFDVSALAPEAVQPGAMIELIGPGHTVDDLAAEAGTIGYEVLTALGARYHRRYLGGEA
jgi:alanine racemase